MRGTSFISTISAIAPISAILLISAHASAVPALPSQWTLVNADQPLVQDGVLLFRFESGPGVAPQLTPTVFDPHSSSIDGTVELLTIDSSASYGIFRPSSVLTEVGDYEIQGTDPFGLSMFSVAPGAIGPDAPPMEAIGMRTSQRMPTLQACCTTAEGIEVGACLALRSAQAPMILVFLVEPPQHISIARQFLYKAMLTDPPELAPNSRWVPRGEALVGWFLAPTAEADNYCFRLDAHRLTDGEVFSVESCVAETIFGDMPDQLPSHQEIFDVLNLYNCPTPPAPLEPAWCEANHAACAEPVNAHVCQSSEYALRCSAHPPSGKTLSELAQEAAAVLDADAGAAVDLGDAGARDVDAADEPTSGGRSSSCSAAPDSHVASTTTPLAWLALAMLMRTRSRRSSRRAKSSHDEV